MLVLSRLVDQEVIIEVDGRIITVVLIGIHCDKAKIGFRADKDVIIHRREVWDRLARERENRDA